MIVSLFRGLFAACSLVLLSALAASAQSDSHTGVYGAGEMSLELYATGPGQIGGTLSAAGDEYDVVAKETSQNIQGIFF